MAVAAATLACDHRTAMPELPDVERFRRFFVEHGAGRRVAGVWSDPAILRNATPEALESLGGATLLEPVRHGKWLVCPSDGPLLLLHFGMTGHLVSSREEPERHRHDRLVLELDDGTELRYRNMRKLGGVWLAHDAGEAAALTEALGPDALSIPKRAFVERLSRRRGGLKAALMDQTFVAGVGNLVADEVLWHAGLHPRRRVDSLAADDLERLHAVLRRVLRRWVRGDESTGRGGPWLLHVRGLPGATCPRCGTPLERTVTAGRTTYHCPTCQPEVATSGR